ncbi:hypothetical protein DV515_00000895 [Chloebia gouldiae]|uniref:Uncharacterized protein n=1 Tax=Chloebia gouldiae TaxID=44316 RepID=A0A3L8T9B4_CHLGU|nr:hypothetical protein DV515_00000895 [Chloebia gouldiae]
MCLCFSRAAERIECHLVAKARDSSEGFLQEPRDFRLSPDILSSLLGGLMSDVGPSQAPKSFAASYRPLAQYGEGPAHELDAGKAQDAEHHRDAECRSCAITYAREELSF